MISIVIPTIAGREDHFERCVKAYESRTISPFELIIERDHPVVGLAWNAGAARASGDHLHLTADDIEPLPGWDIAALGAVAYGWYPAARVDRPDGSTEWWGCERTPQPEGALLRAGWVPFMTQHMWQHIGPSLDIHYCSDDWLSWRASRAGFPNRYIDGYAFIHHLAQVGRGAGMTERQRRAVDARVFEEAKREFTERSSHG